MTTADDLYDDDPLDTPDPQSDEKARKAAAFAQRQQAREAERAELVELRGYKAERDRQDALDKAKTELVVDNPAILNAFLRANPGVEPTPDAIKAAVEADPDFKGLVTFTPDPRDAAAAEQADNARKLAGGGHVATELTAAEVHKWPVDKKARLRKEHPEAWASLMSDTTGSVAAPAGWA